ncbi:MAG: helix-turn-helix domain-containing protein [Bryobacteraceae bacterium]
MQNEFQGLADRLLGGNIMLDEAVEILERSMIEGALALHRGNQSAASKQLGIHRNTLQRKLAGYGLEAGRPRRKPAAKAARGRARRRGVA